MIAFGTVREHFGNTAGVPKFNDVFQFQWTSRDSLEDKWLKRVNIYEANWYDLTGRRRS